MDGILVLDKPAGMTSHDVVLDLRRLVGGVRIGHAGTLDPNATGVLIGLLGKATKISRFLTGLDKEYLFTVELGVETDTLDKWGNVLRTAPTDDVDVERIFDAAARFRGRYQQIAPSLSAIKHQGVPLYKLARRGLATPLKTRVVVIKDFEVIEIAMPFVTIRTACSSGTYVRSLARDMGRFLGCGATVSSIRRLRIGTFTLTDAIPLSDLVEGRRKVEDAVLSIEKALAHLPRVAVKTSSVAGIRAGKQPSAEDFEEPVGGLRGEYFALADDQGSVIGIAVQSGEPEAGLRTERIL